MHISSLSYFLFCTFYRLNLKEHNNTCTLAHRDRKMLAVQSYYLPIYEFIIKGFLFHSRWCITKPMCCSRRLHWCVDKRWCLVYYHPTVLSEFTLINVWQVFVCFSNTFPWLSWSNRTPGKKFIIQWCTQAQVCVYFMYATVLENHWL